MLLIYIKKMCLLHSFRHVSFIFDSKKKSIRERVDFFKEIFKYLPILVNILNLNRK